MRALDRKLLRDLRRIWAQTLAIALVLACGVMVLMLANGAKRSLVETRDAYYERQRFADVFVGMTRAPAEALRAIAALPGVAAVEGRVGFTVVLDLDGLPEPAMARVISLPVAGAPLLNVPVLREGRMPDPLRAVEVAISEPFAQANGLRPGDGFRAVLGGRLTELRVTGIVLSPEFVYSIGPGAVVPDDRRFGLIWIGEPAAAAAQGMRGAVNEAAVRLAPDAREPEVIAAIDRILAPYGGTGAIGRDRQGSHAFLQSELDQLSAMALILPPVFFVVSALLVALVLGRLIAIERPQIGLLKAVGYSTLQIAGHYLRLAGLIGVIGVLAGWGFGLWFGRGMTAMYAQFFHFPLLIYVPAWDVLALSGALGIATVLVGALRGVWSSVRLSPAVAMAPPAPPLFRRGLPDALGGWLRLRQTGMMILRSIVRWPGRAAITFFGVAASVAVLVASFFTFDAMDVMIEDTFDRANRQHVSLMLARAQPARAVTEALSLPGVIQAEGAFALPVRLVAGPRERLTVMNARGPDTVLAQVLDERGRPVRLPDDGLVMPERMAADLGVLIGDRLRIDLLAPPRDSWEVTLVATVRLALGAEVWMAEPAVFDRMRAAPQVNRVNLLVDPAALPDLHAQVKRTPAVAGLTLWPEVRAQLEAMMDENLRLMTVIYSVIGMLITIGVVYNAARIQLSERSHELATLRVLGFTRREVGFVLVGEVMVLTLVALPPGWLLGYAVAAVMVEGFSTDVVTLPLVIERATYGWSSVLVVLTALGSVLVVRRRLDRVDLVSALKARE